LSVLILSSCSDFLNIDEYFDDEFKIDSLFTQTRYVEDYMWGISGMFPDESTVINGSHTPGPLATDEGVTLANLNGMSYVLGEVTPTKPVFTTWTNMYKVIRKCNNIFANIDNVPDLKTSDYFNIMGYTRFIRAYAYYNILVDYGPFILIGDEVLPVNEAMEYYDRTRCTYDEAVEYICSELEEAAKNLPEKLSPLFFGRPTKGAAYGLVARLRLIHASPLFNGGQAASNYFGNWTRKTDGVHYISQTADEKRWALAAATAKRVMDMQIDGLPLYELFTVVSDNKTPALPANVTSDPDYYEPFPEGAAEIDPFKSYSDMFTGEALPQTNPEYVWGRMVDNVEWGGTMLGNTFPHSLGGFNQIAVTQKVIDAYSMVDGSSIENSPLYSETGFSNPPAFSSYQFGNSSIYNMYVNREPRFYASISFSECFWVCGSTTDASNKNKTVKYYYNSQDGKAENASGSAYPLTGYILKKYVNAQDGAFNSAGQRVSKGFGIIRYAEILLSYAEALNNLTGSHTVALGGETYTLSRNTDEIKSAFNQVRHRAGLPGITGDEDAASIQKLIEKERMVEFLYENRRYYDVRRWGIYEDAENIPVTGMNMDADIGSFYQRVVPVGSHIANRIVHKRLVFLPISRNELKRLPSLDQNPGWY
jgi:hypothetical protein